MSPQNRPVTTLRSTWTLQQQLENEEQLNRYRTECELLREKVNRLEQEKTFLVDWEKRSNEKCQKLADELENERATRSKLTVELNQRINELLNEKVKAVTTLKACQKKNNLKKSAYVSEAVEDLACASNSYEETACDPGGCDRNTEIILNVARNVLCDDVFRTPNPEVSNVELTKRQFSPDIDTGFDVTGSESGQSGKKGDDLNDGEQRQLRSRVWPELQEHGTHRNLEFAEKQFSPVSPTTCHLNGNGDGHLGEKDKDPNENPSGNFPDDEVLTTYKRRKRRRGPAELLHDLRKGVEALGDLGGEKQSSNLELTKKNFSTGNGSGQSGMKDMDSNENPGDNIPDDEQITARTRPKRTRGPDKVLLLENHPKRTRGPDKVLLFENQELASKSFGDRKQSRCEGVLTRSMIPVNYKEWRTVPKDLKQQLWEKIKESCQKPESLRKQTLVECSEKWRSFKCKLYTYYVCPHKKEGQLEMLKQVPETYKNFISQEAWDGFLAQRLTPEWEVLHNAQSGRKRNLRNHRGTS